MKMIINTWTIPLVRFSGPFLKMDQGGSQKNEPIDKKVDDSKRIHLNDLRLID